MSLQKRLVQTRFESPAQRAMLSMLVASGHLRRALEEVCASHGITHDQYNVLRILRGVHPDGHPRYAIADRLIDRAPDVTRLLDRLERDGFVERYRSNEDRRLSLSRITEEGLQLLSAMSREVRAVHERFGAGMTSEELGELARLCDTMVGG